MELGTFFIILLALPVGVWCALRIAQIVIMELAHQKDRERAEVVRKWENSVRGNPTHSVKGRKD